MIESLDIKNRTNPTGVIPVGPFFL
jgi:hypothetical protein